MANPDAVTPTTRPPARLQILGVVLIVLSTIAIAMVPSLAKIAYQGGSNTLTVITGRSVVSVFLTLVVVLLMGQPVRIARRPAVIGLVVGAAYGAMLYGYLGAMNYLPVNLVILIYFVHPLLVGVAGALLGRETLTPLKLATLVLAIAGLGLAMGFSLDGIDLRGLALAVFAMFAAAFTILGNAEAGRDAPPLSVCLYMMAGAAVVLTIPMFAVGTVAWPVTAAGWSGLIGVAFLATFGTLTFFTGMPLVGVTRAAMISNLEPILGILLAIAILGEGLTLVQWVGVVMVIGAIVGMEALRTAPGSST